MRYNRIIHTTSLLTAIVGLLDALYLTGVKISENSVLCIPGLGDCWSVTTSKYSEIGGIPISILGAGAYFALIILLFMEERYRIIKVNSPIVIFGITLAGLTYSIYLTFIEISVLNAICPFCVLSAVAMLILFVLAIVRLGRIQE